MLRSLVGSEMCIRDRSSTLGVAGSDIFALYSGNVRVDTSEDPTNLGRGSSADSGEHEEVRRHLLLRRSSERPVRDSGGNIGVCERAEHISQVVVPQVHGGPSE
eukprot:TRINITY_DN12174_c0_g1_i1.p1 TRINITY_DN12174_c0_g1~~TRINITY_DN12174_c0_g1_i1.p1  ORF type:complete len:104 (+),score=9.88 TRINITY_DN12174_c0_g1_i1:152-463(+)